MVGKANIIFKKRKADWSGTIFSWCLMYIVYTKKIQIGVTAKILMTHCHSPYHKVQSEWSIKL